MTKTSLLGLRTVVYKVSDLAAAKRWYSDLLGVEPYFDEPFYVGFNVGGFELGLDPDASGVQPEGGVVAYWGVESLDGAVERVRGMGLRLASEVQDVGQGIRLTTVADPSGNRVGLIENPNFDA